MKKKLIILGMLGIVVIGGGFFWMLKNNKKRIAVTEGVTVVPTMNDLISNDSSWCATFQLVWNDLKNEIVKQDIIFNPQIEMVRNLNKEDFREDMLSDEYYFKIYGIKNKKLLEDIKKGIKEKFNQTSDILDDFDWSDNGLDNEDNLNERRYFFYTMLYREFEYKSRFSILKNGKFGNYDNVKYFGTSENTNNDVRKQIEVLFYNSTDEFAIKLLTKNNDEVIFYKNPTGKTFNEMYERIITLSSKYTDSKVFTKDDKFKAPMIDFNVKREYVELENNSFITADGKKVNIEKAIQTINFSINETGGKVKSEAAMDTKTTSIIHPDPRYFLVDDSFVLFLKESNKDKPYFAVKVDDITKYQK